MAVLHVLCLSAVVAASPERVVLIVDPGIDDAGALLFALGASRSIKVEAIVTNFGGHYDVRQTTHNTHMLLKEARRTDVPVYIGSRWPYGSASPPQHDGQIVHGKNGLAGLTPSFESPTFDDDPSCKDGTNTTTVSGAEFIASIARTLPGQITVVCFSPLTNIALALALEPRLPMLLKALLAMGATFNTPGNVSPLAEANFAHDAAAAAAVCSAFGAATSQNAAPVAVAPFVLAPLDVTHRAIVTLDNVTKTMAQQGGAAIDLFVRAWPTYIDAYCRLGKVCDGAPLHDAHPIAYMLQPDLYIVEQLTFHVLVGVTGSEDSHGMVVVDRRPGQTPARGSCTTQVLMDVKDSHAFVHLVTSNVPAI